MIKSLRINLICSCILVSLEGMAQSYVTYNHDDTKMNQITIQEIGVGGFTPAFYYDALHNSYQKTAASKNKQSYRTLAGIAAYQQVEDADSVKASLEARAKIEALNIADRQIDVAWLAEGTKINNKLSGFQSNINRIIAAGGNYYDKQRWEEYYKMFECAIKATKDAYMPNAQRKKEYLSIYADITKQNDTLIQFLILLNKKSKMEEYFTASYTKPNRKSAIITAAHNRWRDASWKVKGNENTDNQID